MKQIEVFVDSIYKNTKGNKEEIIELKEEMKNHLLEAVQELKAEGKTEKEAIELAIERFGGEQELRSVVAQLVTAQRTFAQWVLYLAIVVLVVSFAVFGAIWYNEESQSHKLSLVATDIATLLEDKTSITPAMKASIQDKVDEAEFISSIRIVDVREFKEGTVGGEYQDVFAYVDHAEPSYQYQKSVWGPEWMGVDFYKYGNGDDQWYVGMEERSFDTFMIVVLFAGIAIYWTLFTIWAIINAYHQKRLNIGWAIGFVLFNVVGYLFYYIVGRKQSYSK